MAHSSGPALHRPALPRIRKPWGEEIVLSCSHGGLCKLLRIRGGERLSLQYHRRKRETLLVLRGRVQLTLGGSPEALRSRAIEPGCRVAIPPGAIHRVEALEDDAELLEFAFGGGGAEDIVRLADDYGRAGLT